MRRIVFLILFILIIPLIFRLFSYYNVNLNDNDKDYREAFLENHKTFTIEIPAEIDFADEKVPLQIFDVRERLDRELLVNVYWQSNTILMFKRASRWFPVIEPILKKNNIPLDFKYLALIESGFVHNVSPAGAQGFWQFMEETAKVYGLEVNNEVDERYNIEKSTEAACKYFKTAYKKYKNWTLVAISYNRGMGGVDKQIISQQQTNFYDLLFNEETSRYIFRVLAMKTIFNHPTRYGFYLRKKDLYPPIPTTFVQVDSSIRDLTKFAFYHKINYKILKEFNPWLRSTKLTNKEKKVYDIKIPKEDYLKYELLMEQVSDKNNILNDTVTLDYIK